MQRLRSSVLSLFRVIVGFLFTCHGAATLFNVLGGAHGGAQPHLGEWPGWWAALIQFVAGGLVTLGLATRVAAVIASGSMAYAYFTVHQPKALFPILNGGEPAVMFCWSFLLLALFGGGSWALDTLLSRRARPAVVLAVEPISAELEV
ncbi:DoxX family protein [Actinoallomurus sp. NBC_01490]|jgi:putative oxidoreductase|uniref:DoxX family protein n=1 Tax=Actinoallomurus sp. NBC_01490 TaxID=2903557 RepID=UPI002E308795|nr:DoxX family protein [Actinoallomurus sp. NBC_01490]